MKTKKHGRVEMQRRIVIAMETQHGGGNELPHEVDRTPVQAKVAGRSVDMELSKSTWFRPARRDLAPALLWALNLVNEIRKGVGVEVASPAFKR